MRAKSRKKNTGIFKNYRYVIGIDEAGRGPIAGPVSVGAVLVPVSFDFSFMDGVRDSKQCTEAAREVWYEKTLALAREGEVRFASALLGPARIDARGINAAITLGVRRVLARFAVPPEECKILLDGLLHAPGIFKFQETIIRGDETEPIISLASIVAKVRRDRYMKRLALRYPNYAFEQHKGYGTKLHYERIEKYGLSEVHRKTFVKDLHVVS